MKRELRIARSCGGKSFPRLNLQGKWLQDLGFDVGTYIEVECDKNMLVIKKKEMTDEKGKPTSGSY